MQAAVENKALTCEKVFDMALSTLLSVCCDSGRTASRGSVMGLDITRCYSTLAQSKAHQGQLDDFSRIFFSITIARSNTTYIFWNSNSRPPREESCTQMCLSAGMHCIWTLLFSVVPPIPLWLEKLSNRFITVKEVTELYPNLNNSIIKLPVILEMWY